MPPGVSQSSTVRGRHGCKAVPPFMTCAVSSAALRSRSRFSVVAELGIPICWPTVPRGGRPRPAVGAARISLRRVLPLSGERRPFWPRGRRQLCPDADVRVASVGRSGLDAATRGVRRSDTSWTAWGKLLSAVRSASPGFQEASARICSEHVTRHPRRRRRSTCSWPIRRGLGCGASGRLRLCRHSPARRCRGGRGALVAGRARRYPAMSGILFDMPPVIATAAATLAGLGRRPLPGGRRQLLRRRAGGADAYALKFVRTTGPTPIACGFSKLPQRDGRRAAASSSSSMSCRRDGSPHFSRFMDLTMLASHRRARADGERVRALARSGDLRLQRSVRDADRPLPSLNAWRGRSPGGSFRSQKARTGVASRWSRRRKIIVQAR